MNEIAQKVVEEGTLDDITALQPKHRIFLQHVFYQNEFGIVLEIIKQNAYGNHLCRFIHNPINPGRGNHMQWMPGWALSGYKALPISRFVQMDEKCQCTDCLGSMAEFDRLLNNLERLKNNFEGTP